MSRLASHKDPTARAHSMRLDSGFADSTGTPSEAGLLIDARRAWDYLTVDKGVPAAKITIMGQSLGTGVSAALCSQLANENISPKALILVAPFSSIAHLLEGES